MLSRRFVVIASVLAILVGAALAAYAYDHGRRGRIADGVRIGSVDVGGLKPAAARSRLRRELLEPLGKPVVVTAGKQRFTLTARRARVAMNLDGMVDEAVRRSREGSIFSRIGRDVTGGTLDADLRPTIGYSHAAVDRFVADVVARSTRKPQDAHLSFTATSLESVASQDGLTVDGRRLGRAVRRALTSPTDRRVTALMHTVKPAVTTDDLAAKYPTAITVDRSGFRLRLWRNLRLEKTYAIAVGRVGLETPAGLYAIQDKQVDPSWHVPNSAWAGDLAGKVIPPGPDDPLKARWMGIYAGAGIHGTDDIGSIGSAASHGCVRMAIPDVIDLYDRVSVGTPVYIA